MVKLMIFVFITCFFKCVVSEVAMPGGYQNIEDFNDPGFQRALKFATKELAVKLESNNKLKVVQIFSARMQVVTGWNYEIFMRIGATNCEVGENDKNCQLKPGGETYKCKVHVWDRPWLNAIELTDSDCVKE